MGIIFSRIFSPCSNARSMSWSSLGSLLNSILLFPSFCIGIRENTPRSPFRITSSSLPVPNIPLLSKLYSLSLPNISKAFSILSPLPRISSLTSGRAFSFTSFFAALTPISILYKSTYNSSFAFLAISINNAAFSSFPAMKPLLPIKIRKLRTICR